MDAAALLTQLHGQVFRRCVLACGVHYEGLAVAARRLRRAGVINNKTAKKMVTLEAVTAWLRHASMPGNAAFIHDLEAQLARRSPLVDGGENPLLGGFTFRACAPEFVPAAEHLPKEPDFDVPLTSVDEPDTEVASVAPSIVEDYGGLVDVFDYEVQQLEESLAKSCSTSLLPSNHGKSSPVEGAWRWPSAAQLKAEKVACAVAPTPPRRNKKNANKKKEKVKKVLAEEDDFLQAAILQADAEREALVKAAQLHVCELECAIRDKDFFCPPCGGQLEVRYSVSAIHFAERCDPCEAPLSSMSAAAICIPCRIAFCLPCVKTFEGFG